MSASGTGSNSINDNSAASSVAKLELKMLRLTIFISRFTGVCVVLFCSFMHIYLLLSLMLCTESSCLLLGTRSLFVSWWCYSCVIPFCV